MIICSIFLSILSFVLIVLNIKDLYRLNHFIIYYDDRINELNDKLNDKLIDFSFEKKINEKRSKPRKKVKD